MTAHTNASSPSFDVPPAAGSDDFDDLLNDLNDKPRAGGGRLRRFWHEVGTLGRLARAVANGEYPLATPQVVALLATLGYVVSPIDAVPDLVPFVGLADDAGVVALTVGTLAVELACFRDWEHRQGRH